MNFIYNNRENKEQYELKNYWINSGSDNFIKKLLKCHDYIFENDFLSMLYGNTIIVKINENLNLDRKSFKKDDIWTILLYSGYITIVDQEDYENSVKIMDNQITKLLMNKAENEKDLNSIQKYKDELKDKICENRMRYVKVPNKEVSERFIELLEITLGDLLDNENNEKVKEYINKFVEGIFEKDINKINENLSEYLLIFSSYHLFQHSNNTYENVYQVLLIQLFVIWKIKGLTAEEDSGYGRYDIGFPNKSKKEEYILIEIKVYKEDKMKKKTLSDDEIENYLHKECVNAIEQIEKKKYESKHRVNNYNSFIKYGIAF